MNNVLVGLKSGNVIELQNIDFQQFLKNINDYSGSGVIFITFDQIVFVVENVEYIKLMEG